MAKKASKAEVPAMDYPEHERTYAAFLKLLTWGTISCIVILVLMALFLL